MSHKTPLPHIWCALNPHLWAPAPLNPTPMEPSAPLTPIYVSLFPLNLMSVGPNTTQTQSVGPSAPLTPICEVQTHI